ncbi:MAG TPA: peptide-methionine (S)-S-oxide reductase MsrA [Urbifossiella sp.]|jgi:peptide-methionine (S)-S-oxide reductase
MNESSSENQPLEYATLGGGCFWCMEAVFEMLNGVERVESGYTGGSAPHPSYKAVCTGATGHAEVIRVAFNPKVITYREILEVFFVAHDPTTLNRQGNDVGTQYRSAIFYHSPEQRETAMSLIRELNEQKLWPNPIVTEVTPAPEFFKAEDYHQGYYRANPDQGYCQLVVSAKVAKARKAFAGKMTRL